MRVAAAAQKLKSSLGLHAVVDKEVEIPSMRMCVWGTHWSIKVKSKLITGRGRLLPIEERSIPQRMTSQHVSATKVVRFTLG